MSSNGCVDVDTRLSAVMIARNERENIAPCLGSFWDYVDEVVLCDTGSRDGTIKAARDFAASKREQEKLVVTKFKWCNDFAAAREHAHEIATGNVHFRIDLDDRIVGGEHLPTLKSFFGADPQLISIMALWSGPITPPQWRAQIFRPPAGWYGRTYEFPVLSDGLAKGQDLVQWQHTRIVPRGRRDLEIALEGARDESWNWRPLNAAGEEAMILGLYNIVEDCCLKAAKECDPKPPIHTRAYFLQLHARARYALGDWEGAAELARKAIKVVEREKSTDTDFLEVAHKAWLCLTRCELRRRDEEILTCARKAIETATLDGSRAEVVKVVGEHVAGKNLPALLAPKGKTKKIQGSTTSSAVVRWAR